MPNTGKVDSVIKWVLLTVILFVVGVIAFSVFALTEPKPRFYATQYSGSPIGDTYYIAPSILNGNGKTHYCAHIYSTPTIWVVELVYAGKTDTEIWTGPSERLAKTTASTHCDQITQGVQ